MAGASGCPRPETHALHAVGRLPDPDWSKGSPVAGRAYGRFHCLGSFKTVFAAIFCNSCAISLGN